MADQFRKKALVDQFGLTDEDPLQQPDPEATQIELPPVAPAPDMPPPAPPGAPTWSKGVNPNTGMILGYDLGKLNDKSYTSGKYNPAVRAFSEGLKNDVGVSRGGLGNMLNFLKANGFPQAQLVGDDKIDFGDGAGPIDVIRSDGQIVFQDPRGAGAGAGAGAPTDGAATGAAGLLGGNPLDAIRAELAKLMGGNGQPNLQALLAQLGLGG